MEWVRPGDGRNDAALSTRSKALRAASPLLLNLNGTQIVPAVRLPAFDGQLDGRTSGAKVKQSHPEVILAGLERLRNKKRPLKNRIARKPCADISRRFDHGLAIR